MNKMSAHEYVHAISKAASFALRTKRFIKRADMNIGEPKMPDSAWELPTEAFDENGTFYIPKQKSIPPRRPGSKLWYNEGRKRFGSDLNTIGYPRRFYTIKDPSEIQHLGQISEYYRQPVYFGDESGNRYGAIDATKNGYDRLSYSHSPYRYRDPGAHQLEAQYRYWKGRIASAEQEARNAGYNLQEPNQDYQDMVAFGGDYETAMGKKDAYAASKALMDNMIPAAMRYEMHLTDQTSKYQNGQIDKEAPNSLNRFVEKLQGQK